MKAKSRRSKEDVETWLTEDRLNSINSYRERAGVGPLSREEAISYLTYFEEPDWKTMKERIG